MASAFMVDPPERRVLLHGVSWRTYDLLMADYANHSAPRFTYDRGDLEIVWLGSQHERANRTLAGLVEIVAATRSVPIRSVGSMTYRRPDCRRGFEADSSFHVRREPLPRGKRTVDPAIDPPPDLAIEVDFTPAWLDKLSIFAEMGVDEVWRCDGQQVTILTLVGGGYRASAESVALPPLTADDLTRFLADRRAKRSTAWFRSVEEWAATDIEHRRPAAVESVVGITPPRISATADVATGDGGARLPEEPVVLSYVRWETYESLLEDHRERSVPRFTYDQGALEIVRPTPIGEELHLSLATIVVTVPVELDIDFRPMGSTTYRRQSRQQGFEADSSFYIQTTRFAREMVPVDPTVDPPPDLVIEGDVTHQVLDRLPIYAGFGVPEVWRGNAQRVTMLLLDGGAYREATTSRAIPILSSASLTEFLAQRQGARQPEWIRAVRAWARAQRAGTGERGR